MSETLKRRDFLCRSMVLTAFFGGIQGSGVREDRSPEPFHRVGGARVRISLNAYSFNSLLSSGRMDLNGLLEYCAREGFDAVDPTGYYFPGYPAAPSDSLVFDFRRKASLLGLDISGTGVRTNFTDPDPGNRQKDVELVYMWLDVASKLGAPSLRVFAGRRLPAELDREKALEWVVDALRRCVEKASTCGVMVALQNHAEFIETSDQVLEILSLVNSEWLGINLDIGSFRKRDPYSEISRIAPFAVNWQIKEKVYENGKEQAVDLNRIVKIVEEAGYRGYLPLETLGEGDLREQMRQFLGQMRQALGQGATA